jgi:predicted phosphate transport protein (TIGR00153 family)
VRAPFGEVAVAFRLIPREEKFFDDFVEMAGEIKQGAVLLVEMLEPERPVWEKAQAIKVVEHRCDEISHDVLQRLHRTFVTPIDREDIHELLGALDDVIDDIDASADMLRLYRIETVRPAARELSRHIVEAASEMLRGVGALAKGKGVLEAVREISNIENKADGAYTTGVGTLFEEEKDPIQVIKWKEILDMLEGATDRCKDVAKVLEAIFVKHS